MATAALVIAGIAGTLANPASAGASSTVPALPPNGRVDVQLGGDYAPVRSVKVVDRDSTGEAVEGVYSICYVNAFQTQDYQKDFWTKTRARRALLLKDATGEPYEDPNWPGEFILDTRTRNKRAAIAKIEYTWIDACKAKGFQAIDPDNLDTWTRFPQLERAGNLALATLLAKRAHGQGMAIAQKNAGELSRKTRLAVGFDFAVVESCQVYDECGLYDQAYGDSWFEIEYTTNGAGNWQAACAERGDRISVIYRDQNIVPRGESAYHFQEC
nr:endo alpha-1,4 polygalactosaminidase [Kineosporia mesophila]